MESVGFCQLVGPIPEELGQLRNLELLFLAQNHLNGTIPASIGELVLLELLNLKNNQLSGEIPVSLSKLERLEFLDLSNNQLEGAIQEELLRLLGMKLHSIGFQNNNFTGNVTLDLGTLYTLNLALLRCYFIKIT